MRATPDFDFQLGEAATMIRDSAARFADEQIAPLAERTDREDRFPRELWEPMGALGLHGITVEEEWGGLGLGYLEHVIAVEEVSRASASVGLSYGAHSNLCLNQIRRWGNDEQKAKYLPRLISGEHVGSLAMSEAGAGSVVLEDEEAPERVARTEAQMGKHRAHCVGLPLVSVQLPAAMPAESVGNEAKAALPLGQLVTLATALQVTDCV